MGKIHVTPRTLVAVLCLIGGTMPLQAQVARTTFPHLSTRADTIVQAEVTSTDHDDYVRRVTFLVESTIKGESAGALILSEANTRACGEVLHGLSVGAKCLIFLEGSVSGPRLAMGSPQSLVTDPEVQAHVRGMLSAKTTAETLSLLSGALTSRSAGVRQDAALSLSLMLDLGRASAADHERIVSALASSLGEEDLVALSLIRTAARLNISEAVDILVPHYLSGRSAVLKDVLLDAIPNLDSVRALALVSTQTPQDIRGQTRAVELLQRFGRTESTAPLRRLEESRSPVVSGMAERALSEGPVRKRFRSILRHRER